MSNVREIADLNNAHDCHATNPECVAGKHTNCDGLGWCPVVDEAVACTCPCHQSAASAAEVSA